MKTLLPLITAVALAFLSAPVFAGETESLEDLAGIPVMEGFHEDAGQRIVFDKPEGRIVHAVLEGTGEASRAADFYKQALPQLGWRLTDERKGIAGPILFFDGEDEQLTVRIHEQNKLEIEFDIKPKA